MIKNKKKQSDISQAERNLINLSTGKKKPTSESEKQLLAQIDKIKKKGGQIHVPHD